MAQDDAFYLAAERRIELLTLGLGAVAAVTSAAFWSGRAMLGIALGTALAWINYRWLKQGIAVFARLATAQQGAETVRVPKSVYVKFFGRFVLLVGVAYAILSRSWLPVLAVLAGLSTLVAAVFAEVCYQLVRGDWKPVE